MSDNEVEEEQYYAGYYNIWFNDMKMKNILLNKLEENTNKKLNN